MPMDDRKQRIMMAIVSLYGAEGEPVGSNLLSRYFDMAVSSATLRNEMAVLTRLGLLEQPHTSAGRVPTAKGYRYYVDNLLDTSQHLAAGEKHKVDAAFRKLDYDPEKMVQGAARTLSEMLGSAVIATTPRADDMVIAHYELVQVGRYTTAVLAVTGAGGVRTRVAKMPGETSREELACVAETLNSHLCFVAEADAGAALIRTIMDQFGAEGPGYWPLVSAALTLLSEVGRPSVYFEGHQNVLRWPELGASLRTLMQLAEDAEKLDKMLHAREGHTTILFGDEMADTPLPGLSFVSRRYLAGGGLSGTITVVGPVRTRYRELVPRLEYFCELLGRGMSSGLAG